MAPRPAERGVQQSLCLDPAETLGTGRIMDRALATSPGGGDQVRLARSFGYRAVTSWWRAIVAGDRPVPPLREPPLAFDPAELPKTALALADSTGQAAAQLGPETRPIGSALPIRDAAA